MLCSGLVVVVAVAAAAAAVVVAAAAAAVWYRYIFTLNNDTGNECRVSVLRNYLQIEIEIENP